MSEVSCRSYFSVFIKQISYLPTVVDQTIVISIEILQGSVTSLPPIALSHDCWNLVVASIIINNAYTSIIQHNLVHSMRLLLLLGGPILCVMIDLLYVAD